METIKKYRLLLIAFFAALILKFFVFDIYKVNGDSMSPYLKSGDIILVEKLSYKFKEPEIGDVIVLKEDTLIIKRIAAVENDKIKFTENDLYVNDKLQINDIHSKGVKEESIPKDYFYVIGDNKNLSLDSRIFGPIHRDAVIGRYLFKLIPWKALFNIGLFIMIIEYFKYYIM